MSERIVVTGLGATTPLGGDVDSTWAALLEAKSGARYLEEEWAEGLPVRLAAPAAVDPASVLERVVARRLDRSQQFALVAAREAWADAGLSKDDIDPDRLAVCLATGVGGVTTTLSSQKTLDTSGPRAVSPVAVTMLMPNGPAATVGLEFGARAGVHAPVSACASGTEGISLALDLLQLGRADIVIAGGTEAPILPLPLAGFAQMRALSTRDDEPESASRPFDKARDGFVLAEGAGVMILETESHALARGAHIHGVLVGSAITSDAHHLVAPDPTGAGAARAVTLTLQRAGLTPADVIHINAHATSTPAGDVAEAAAIRLALGDAADGVAVSATKGSTGHLLGGAGGIEAVFTVLALKHRLAPPTRNLDDPDDAVTLDVVRMVPRALAADGIGISTSFGFGGHNAALAFRSWSQ